ncbi:MAG: hypothetical protein O2894_06020 [Planctomycetota bacterium]|nr:hypothetical protein [Planctomycetota bacterium]
MRPVRARAPVRIDLAGGTLDIWPLGLCFPPGAVTVNAALDLPVEAEVRPAADETITLRSTDLACEAVYASRAELRRALDEGACELPLLGHAVLALAGRGGLCLTTNADLPAGSGLGGSSALLAATLGALDCAYGGALDARALQALAQDVETSLLRTPTGYQDYFPPLLGGCLALERRVGGLDVHPVPVDLAALAERLRLVWTGEPHHSGLTNWGAVRAYLAGEPATVEALGRIACAARGVWEALAAADLDGALQAMLADGAARHAMAPGIATPTIDALDRAVRAAGALGTKICGAGGGGCVLVLLPAGSSHSAIDRALEAGPGVVLPLRLTAEGLRLERLDS